MEQTWWVTLYFKRKQSTYSGWPHIVLKMLMSGSRHHLGILGCHSSRPGTLLPERVFSGYRAEDSRISRHSRSIPARKSLISYIPGFLSWRCHSIQIFNSCMFVFSFVKKSLIWGLGLAWSLGHPRVKNKKLSLHPTEHPTRPLVPQFNTVNIKMAHFKKMFSIPKGCPTKEKGDQNMFQSNHLCLQSRYFEGNLKGLLPLGTKI